MTFTPERFFVYSHHKLPYRLHFVQELLKCAGTMKCDPLDSSIKNYYDGNNNSFALLVEVF